MHIQIKKKPRDTRKNKIKAFFRIAGIIVPAILLAVVLFAFPSLAFGQVTGNNAESVVSVSYVSSNNSEKLISVENKSGIVREGKWSDSHPVRIKGKGTLDAEGNGAVRIKGRTDGIDGGVIKISGNGVLTVRDLTGDINKQISGYEGSVELKKGLWMYYGFNGEAEISGSGFVINISGMDIKINATAKAIVFLAGDGSYEVEKSSKV